MSSRDPRVDAYIEKAPPFAQPILRHLREVVHEACPDVEETIKWGTPNFMYHGMLGGMAAFKAHCAFGLWRGSLITDAKGKPLSTEGAGDFGKITSIADLPSKKVLAGYVKQASKLNESGTKTTARSKTRDKKDLVVPEYFTTALKRNRKAAAAFERFSYSHRREYIEWLEEARTEATRNRRLDQAIEWLAEGKSRNWKYEPGKAKA